MSQDNELRRLEQFVEKLLARFNDLREENATLQQNLRQRGEEIEKLQLSLSAREEERSEITQRVGRMVEQIEEWEAALGGDGAVAQAPAVEEFQEEPETSEEPEQVAKPVVEQRREEDVRVQHNLFSLGAASR